MESDEIGRTFDERAAGYDDDEMHSGMHRNLADAVAAFADLSRVGSVLDVATGTGLLLRALEPGPRLVGVDLSDGMLAVARRALPTATFVRADATALPFPDASFDLVTCVAALRFFDAATAFAEWRRVLAPHGAIVVTAWLPEGVAVDEPASRSVDWSFVEPDGTVREAVIAEYPAVRGG